MPPVHAARREHASGPVSLTVPADGQSHTVRVWPRTTSVPGRERLRRAGACPAPDAGLCPGLHVHRSRLRHPALDQHPCISAGLTDPQVVGGLEYPTTITPDSGTPPSSPWRQRSRFRPAKPPVHHGDGRQASRPPARLRRGQQLKVRDLSTGLYQMIQTAPAPIRWIEFDVGSSRLGRPEERPAGRDRLVIAEDQSCHMQSHPEGDNLQFNPADPRQSLSSRRRRPPLPVLVELFRTRRASARTDSRGRTSPSYPQIAWSRTAAGCSHSTQRPSSCKACPPRVPSTSASTTGSRTRRRQPDSLVKRSCRHLRGAL